MNRRTPSAHSIPRDELHRLIARANLERSRHDVTVTGESAVRSDAEHKLDALFEASRTLAVYGTLAPGQPNHHIVAPLGGEWAAGVIEGDLFPEGWGAILGYPAFRPRAGGVMVAVQVLVSPNLPSAWTTLDRFEGPEYRRILVPVFTPGPAPELLAVANVYAAAESR